MTAEDFRHEPVMAAEIVELFRPVPNGVFVDATLGGAGHAVAVLEAHDGLELVGFDQDPVAIEAARRRLMHLDDRSTIVHARFDRLGDELDRLGVDAISGVLFDLGVSSHQLDEGDRGFSFRHDGPLDMRMDTTTGSPATTLVNTATVDELATILRELGDERHAKRIATAIVAARPIERTAELAEVIADAMPAASRRSPGHPARRSFQALRISVNEELDVLEPALGQAIERLVPAGRGAVLSYHSGEDRIVKRTLRTAAALDRHVPPGLPVEREPGVIELLGRGGRTPTAQEIERNPRASSARLRAFVKLEEAA